MERIEHLLPLEKIRPNPRNARNHSRAQIREIAESIKACGFTAPVLVDEHFTLMAGHGRLAAAQSLGHEVVPAVELRGLSDAQKRAIALADNKLCDKGGWNREQLAIELPELADLLVEQGLDIAITGFAPAEIDQLQLDFEEDSTDPEDEVKSSWVSGPLVSELGSMWILGPHRLLCGDARSERDLDRLMDGSAAAAAFLDPPYNLRVRGIGGRGRIRHAEFRMGSGEMSPVEYGAFLASGLGNAARVSRAGAVHYVCCDWRHVVDVLTAGTPVYGAIINLAVWVKNNAGQGSFYRSAHELVAVFRVGAADHLNNVQLGRHGRSRSNVWKYGGVNSFRMGRMEELRAHPTAKPVALVADAIRDCTRRGDIVLDLFGGSATTLMAAERVGRRGYVMELEPRFVDIGVRRWQAFTRKDAVHAESGQTFDELAAKCSGKATKRLTSHAQSLARNEPK